MVGQSRRLHENPEAGRWLGSEVCGCERAGVNPTTFRRVRDQTAPVHGMGCRRGTLKLSGLRAATGL